MKKRLRIIAGSACLYLAASLPLVAAPGLESQAQRITLKKTNITVEDLLNHLREKTSYDFLYSRDVLVNTNPISIDLKNASLEEILSVSFKNQPLIYTIKDNTIVIQTNRNKVGTASVQQRISGTVTGPDKKPVAGVSVTLVQNEKLLFSTHTNDAGYFELPRAAGATHLVLTHIGYSEQSIRLTANPIYNVELETQETSVGEVLVTGIFSRPMENFTGSAITIQGEDIRKISSVDVFKSIAALDPAFNLIADNVAGGNINQLPEIQIRGQNSFPTLSDDITTNPNQPLFILDGFEVSIERIKDLDINIIQSVVILKDASATTIYGSRGANGVMVINTLAPEPGKLRVSVINDISVSTPDLSVYRLLDARQKLDFEQRAGVYFDEDPNQQYALTQLYNERLKAVTGGIDTDWRNLAVQAGISNRTTISVSGGDQAVRYGIAVGANLQNGVMKEQDRSNYTGQFDFSYLFKNIRLSNSARYYQTMSNESPYGSFSTYLLMNPYWAPYDENGEVPFYLENFTADGLWIYNRAQTNPLYNATLNTINGNRLTGFQNNFNIRYDVMRSFFIDTKLGVTKESVSSDNFLPGTHTSFNNVTDPSLKGRYTKGQTERLNYEFSTSLNYLKGFGKHLMLGTFSFEVGSRETDGYTFAALGFPTDNLDHLLYATQYTPNSRPAGSEGKNTRVGLLLNGNYSYNNRYLADISVRRDGSSLYGTDRKFGDFWSLGLGWNIHNEEFFATSKQLNRLRLRATYGLTGSLEIPSYTSLTQYQYDVNNTYDGGLGVTLRNIGNPGLGWQEKKELNVGIDAELLNNRLNIRAEYYNSTTDQAITELSLAPSVGFNSYYENYGNINNKGVELAVQYKIIDRPTENMSWVLFANGLHNKNTLLKISDQLRSLNERLNSISSTIPNFLFEEGKSTTSLFAVRSLGIDPATGREVYLKKDGTKTYTWSASEKIAAGNTLPKLQGTLGTNLYYKGFELGLIVDYRYGGQIYNQTLVDRVENINPLNNVDERAYHLGWAQPGDVSLYRQIHLTNNITHTTTRFVEDENSLNLNSISVGFLFNDQPFIKKMGISSLRMRAITNDVARFSTVQIERGTSNPFARIYSLSLNASF